MKAIEENEIMDGIRITDRGINALRWMREDRIFSKLEGFNFYLFTKARWLQRFTTKPIVRIYEYFKRAKLKDEMCKLRRRTD